MLLQDFKDEFLDSLLLFLWRQWTSLGVAGYGITAEIKHLMDDNISPGLVKSGFGQVLGQFSGVWGEEYLTNWIYVMNKFLTQVCKK